LSGNTGEVLVAGTGNPGAYNVSKQIGRGWGYIVGAADLLKGAVAAGIGRRIAGDAGCYAAATTSVLGHAYPPGRKGGRAVATSFGANLVAFPVYAPIDVAIAGMGAIARRHATTGSRTAPAVLLTTSGFVVAAMLWSWRRWPTLWGPATGLGLVAYAGGTSAVLFARWLPLTR